MSAYKIVVDKEGCQHCGGERTWTIEGPDEVCIGTSWGDEEFASDICDLMNMAFDAGKEAPAPEEQRQFEEKPVAWLIQRPDTVGEGRQYEVTLTPLTDDTYMDEGDVAYPLYRQVYTQEALDEADKRSAERHAKLRLAMNVSPERKP